MLLRSEAKVGLIVAVAIAALITVYWFLGGWRLRAASYPIYTIFSDARKLDKGADVRMAGVKIGWISGIRLTRRSRARVDMGIQNGNDIPVDSVARITQGGFIGDNYVEIMPGSADRYLRRKSRIRSGELVQFDQILADVSDVLKELKTSAAGINEILGDKEVVATVKETVTALNTATQSASELIESVKGVMDKSSPEIQRALSNLAAATGNAARVSRQIEDMIAKDARPGIRLILSKAGEAMTNLDDAMADANELIGDMRKAAGTANAALERLGTVAEQAYDMMVKLDEASEGIKDLTTDKELREDLKRTMRNTAEASEQAKELMTRLNLKYGSGRSGPTPDQKSAIPEYGVSVNSLWKTNDGSYRFDANYTFAGAGPAFYRVGAYNVGENTRLNLQGGIALDQSNAFRYGLYASRVGLGYDRWLGESCLLSADLFRPNDPEMELRGVLGIGGGFGLYGGVVDLFDKDNQDVLVGIRYNK